MDDDDPFFKVPEAVVVDAHDGYVFWRDAAGELFTVEAAQEFAEHRNAEMKPQYQKFVVRLLTEQPAEDTSYRPFSDWDGLSRVCHNVADLGGQS